MKRSRTFRVIVYCVIAVLSALIGVAASLIPMTWQWELRTYDYRFRLRGALPESASPPITLLLIDDASLEKIKEPLMLWHGYFADLLTGLADAGASAVGVDFLFSDIEKIDSAAAQKLNEALIRTGEAGLPIVLAYRVRESGVERPPLSILMAAGAARHAFGYVNLTSDSDDFIRRQRLDAEAKDPSGHSPSFAFEIARAFAAKTGRKFSPPAADTIFINFRQRQAFPKVSFITALEAVSRKDTAFMRSTFGNRIVLIASSGGRGGEDMHSTPHYYWQETEADGLKTSGAEIHANTIATLLNGDAIHELGSIRQSLLILLCAAALTFFWSSLRTMSALAATAAWVAVFGFVVIASFGHGVWIWIVSPMAACVCAAGLTQSANYFFEGRDRRRIQGLFGRYVSDQVIAQLLDNGIVPGGERRRIAVLFADIRNFTTRSESARPEDIVDLLNQYFTEIVAVIQAHGGTVNSLMGDGLMAMFGAPIFDADAALHAVEAACDMMRAVQRVNARLASPGMEPIRIGVGINAGDAVIGNMGSPRMMEYTAIGDVVNTASRIEGKTKDVGADILIGQPVFEWIGNRIPTEFRGEVHVKGRVAAIPVYAVLWDL